MIDARYEKFTLYEQRILLKLLVMISPDDKVFKDYEFSISEFTKEFDFVINYIDLKKSVEKFVGRTIQINIGRRGWKVFNYLSYAEYVENEGMLRIKLNPLLAPYLLGLKERFKNKIGRVTVYHVKYVAGLSKAYSLRIYELLKKHSFIGDRIIFVEDLIKYLCLHDTYHIYGNLKMAILTPCINEINEKTDIDVSFEEIKYGHKVVKIKFNIRKNNKITERKKEKKKIKESDGQTFVDDSGQTITEKGFIEELMNDIATMQAQNPDIKIEGGRQKQKNFIRQAVRKAGLKRVHQRYCDEACARGDFINFYYKGMWLK